MDGGYHGMLTTAGTNFAMQATEQHNQLKGKIYGLNGPFEFTATLQGTSLTLNSNGGNEMFYKVADTHFIANLDLTVYMVDNSNSGNTVTKQMEPEQSNTHSNTTNNNSPYPALNNQEVLNLISGSQLVFYQRTSYVSDNMASSITYVNFCPNGYFSMNYDGSYSVSGTYGGNAQGASKSSDFGTWKLVSYEGQPAVYLQYSNGETSINAFNINNLRNGRWKIGNTQYALVRNKVRCE